MVEVLNADGSVWAANKLALADIAGAGALIAVYWNRLPELLELRPCTLGLLSLSCWPPRAEVARSYVLLPLVFASAGDFLFLLSI